MLHAFVEVLVGQEAGVDPVGDGPLLLFCHHVVTVAKLCPLLLLDCLYTVCGINFRANSLYHIKVKLKCPQWPLVDKANQLTRVTM